MDPKYPPPTEIEWAKAEVQVIRFSNSPIIGLRKDLEKNNVPYTQTVWLTIPPGRHPVRFTARPAADVRPHRPGDLLRVTDITLTPGD